MRISPRTPCAPPMRPTVNRTCSTGVVGSGPLVSRSVGGRLRARFFGAGRLRWEDNDGESVFDSPLPVSSELVVLVSSFNIQAHSYVLTGTNDHQDRANRLSDP